MKEIYGFSWPWRENHAELARQLFTCLEDTMNQGNMPPSFVYEIGLVRGDSTLVCFLTDTLDNKDYEKLKSWILSSNAPEFDEFEVIPSKKGSLVDDLKAPYDVKEYFDIWKGKFNHHLLI